MLLPVPSEPVWSLLAGLNTTIATGVNGATWSHTVAVVVPKVVKVNQALIYLTGSCNHNPTPPKGDDEELMIIARIAHQTGVRRRLPE